ncbi:GH15371 [Drosophila grimshawi]|uniref:GH15371 n=2 Tax=Drosophila grimshawi TaxID=7222 RepID=B4J386_DROGR|nr:GH15371 [Drosophila grimshawi]
MALEVKAAPDCKKKEAAEGTKAKPDCKKKEAPESKQNDEMVIRGGSQCKKPTPPKPPLQDAQKALCEKLILKREELNKSKGCQKGNKESGGGSKDPCTPCPRPAPSFKDSKKWKNITLMGVLPIVAILTILVFTTRGEGERPEFKAYPHMYQRTKPFFWGDGNHSRFHNSYWNALPPDGYEDEIDVEAAGKTPETAKEQEQRLKEFSTVHKEWKKMNDKRVAEAKKAAAAAEKEAKKQQAQAEKEQKRQQAEAEKEAKKQQAEAEKEIKKQQAEVDKEAKRLAAEAKKQQAEAEKEEKRIRAESEKELKRQEEEAKKAARAKG